MIFVHKYHRQAELVALGIVQGKFLPTQFKRCGDAGLVDKRQQQNPQPGQVLAVGINRNVTVVQIENRRLWIGHKPVARLGQGLDGVGREHGKELLDRAKWLGQFELNLPVAINVAQI